MDKEPLGHRVAFQVFQLRHRTWVFCGQTEKCSDLTTSSWELELIVNSFQKPGSWEDTRCICSAMIIARAAIMVAIEHDENACYLLLASFPWGKTASIGQVNEITGDISDIPANVPMPLAFPTPKGCLNISFSLHQQQIMESPVLTNMNSHWLSENQSTASHWRNESGSPSDVTWVVVHSQDS